MDSENTCSACSWSPARQKTCYYNSHVKLFYGASTRGAWSLGSHLILKERSADPPNFEAANIEFLESRTSIPIPKVVEEWEENDGTYFIITRRIPSQPLDQVWSSLSLEYRERVAKQTAEYLMQLREIRSNRLESIGGRPLYNAFLFLQDYETPHGPFSSDDELWAELSLALTKVPEQVRAALRWRMPPAAPYTFTHSDLTIVNIMVDPDSGNVTGILDWENSGYFPVWWEYAAAGIGLGDEDAEWKKTLRKYLPDHAEAREFWWDFYALKDYPDLSERGLKFLEECGLPKPKDA